MLCEFAHEMPSLTEWIDQSANDHSEKEPSESEQASGSEEEH